MKILEGKEEYYTKFLDNNKDEYGKAIIDFSIRWADCLEELINNSIEDPKTIINNNAAETATIANSEGITGAMYCQAVLFLNYVWEYGSILNSWHNKFWGLNEDTEGTANPSVLFCEIN